jgi:hypothetical protein
MPVWPAALPQIPLVGAEVDEGDRVLRTQMDTGIADLALIDIATAHPQRWPFVLTLTQFQRLREFRQVDCGGGVLSFTARDPLSRTTRNFRFVGPLNGWRCIEGNAGAGRALWSGTVNVEEVP